MTAGTTLAKLDRALEDDLDRSDRGWTWLVETLEATREDYIHLLVVTYGFEAPYDAACAYTPGLGQLIDLRGRWRSGLIAQDLLALGWTPEQITSLKYRELAMFDDAAEAIGWMYVVERSTLIHEAVRLELLNRWADFLPACVYLGAYGRVASKRRAELGIALDRLCSNDEVFDRVHMAARDASDALLAWHRTNQVGLRRVG